MGISAVSRITHQSNSNLAEQDREQESRIGTSARVRVF
jgi:hypothetical protein